MGERHSARVGIHVDAPRTDREKIPTRPCQSARGRRGDAITKPQAINAGGAGVRLAGVGSLIEDGERTRREVRGIGWRRPADPVRVRSPSG